MVMAETHRTNACRWNCRGGWILKYTRPSQYDFFGNCEKSPTPTERRRPLPPPVRTPRQLEDSARSNLALLLDYFQSRFFKPEFSPAEQAVEICRALAGVSVTFVPSFVLERVVRDRAIGQAVNSDGSQTMRRRLADLHRLDRSELAKIARQYARGMHRKIDKERSDCPDPSRLFPADGPVEPSAN